MALVVPVQPSWDEGCHSCCLPGILSVHLAGIILPFQHGRLWWLSTSSCSPGEMLNFPEKQVVTIGDMAAWPSSGERAPK